MILNSDTLVDEGIVVTRNLGAKAQVGYDLTVKGIKRVKGGYITRDSTVINDYEPISPTQSPDGRSMYRLTKGVYAVEFQQGIKLPNGVTGFVIQRSSLKRIGASIQSPVFDPGFETDNIGTIMVVEDESISIEEGARIAQLVCYQSQRGELYDGQFQRDKDVK